MFGVSGELAQGAGTLSGQRACWPPPNSGLRGQQGLAAVSCGSGRMAYLPARDRSRGFRYTVTGQGAGASPCDARGGGGFILPSLARNQGALCAAGQRPTAPSGGRFCNVSLQNFCGRRGTINRLELPLQRPPGGQALPCDGAGGPHDQYPRWRSTRCRNGSPASPRRMFSAITLAAEPASVSAATWGLTVTLGWGQKA